MAKKLPPKQRVLKLAPTAFYKNMGTVPHHRIFRVVRFADGTEGHRLIGQGITVAGAWTDAENYLRQYG